MAKFSPGTMATIRKFYYHCLRAMVHTAILLNEEKLIDLFFEGRFEHYLATKLELATLSNYRDTAMYAQLQESVRRPNSLIKQFCKSDIRFTVKAALGKLILIKKPKAKPGFDHQCFCGFRGESLTQDHI